MKSIAMIANMLSINGISEVVCNYCRYLDKNKYTITIFAGPPINDIYKAEYKKLGVDVVELPHKTSNPLGHYLELFEKLKKGKFDIIHVHGNSATMAIYLLIARLVGIKVRIAHCHNSQCVYKSLHTIMLPIFRRTYTKGLACSSLAGEWLFGKNNYTVILNGFDYNRFLYNQNYRNEIREEIGVGNDIVIGHIGQMNDQKNQEYLLSIFDELSKNRNDISLVLAGSGPLFDEINNKISNHKNKEKIILYGETNAPEKLYCAFDIFLFPSKYEGFGMVMTEAQTSGLPCIASMAVPKDVVVSDDVTFLPIERENISFWVDEVLRLIDRCNIENRKNVDIEKLKKFDIKENVKLLESCYEKN